MSSILQKMSNKTDSLQNFCVHRTKPFVSWMLLLLVIVFQVKAGLKRVLEVESLL